jgi:uncharacterized protein YifN (PemK superfamily)
MFARMHAFPAKAGWSLRLARCCSGPGNGDVKLLRVPCKPPLEGALPFWRKALPLGYYFPRPGDVLICDYSTGFVVPEMVKHRPVVVVSGRERNARGLCTVVPLSTTAPDPIEAWHHCFDVTIPGWAEGTCWAKCDMLATVGFKRLDKPHTKTRQSRQYHTVRIGASEVAALRLAVLAYLNF